MQEPHLVKKPLFSRSALTGLIAGFLVLSSAPILSQILIGLPVDRRISLLTNQLMILSTVLPFLACVLGVPVSLFALLFPKARYSALRALLVCLAGFVFLFAGMQARFVIRTKQFEQLADHSRPLISAIKRFEKDHSKPPTKLDELVPLYINEIPHTGMGAYPDYEYKLSTEAPGPDHLAAPWELSVDCPVGMLNWDVFYYLPTEKYPQHDYGGYIERIKNWAYVHE
ncbi:MAG: hypothetical protein WCT03_24945 [Candidatus Obscuribacterales bacterium]|jgi:hypothetical protein